MLKVNIIMCTSENCPVANKCYRSNKSLVKENVEKFNFEYTCNENSGFEDFISVKHFNDA